MTMAGTAMIVSLLKDLELIVLLFTYHCLYFIICFLFSSITNVCLGTSNTAMSC